MAIREIDAISNAIIETEREIAGAAWDQEDTELDQTGDRSLEDIGEGLEGQQEPEDDEDTEGDDADDETESETEDEDGKAETEDDNKAAAAAKDGKGEKSEAVKPAASQQPEGRVPSGKLREANEAKRAAEAERDALKAKIETGNGDLRSLNDRLELALRQIDDLRRAPRSDAKPAEPEKPATAPDLFEDPKGFVDFITTGFKTELSKRDAQLSSQRVETSMAIAHAFHKDTFEKAFEGINKLDPRNPDDRVTVQRIYASPNPGEALVSWHKRQQTLAEVGDDPTAYRERVAKETREALTKDPEFRKQLIADLRGEANRGDDGKPRTTHRLPPALALASGSNLGAERNDVHGADDSEQAVADAAWR